jgi:hypothetical protein
MGRPTVRFPVPPIFLIIVGILFLATSHHSTYVKSTILKISLEQPTPTVFINKTALVHPEPKVSTENARSKEDGPPPEVKPDVKPEVKADKSATEKPATENPATEKPAAAKEPGPESPPVSHSPGTEATALSEKGDGGFGRHFHVQPSPAASAGVEGCAYPILIHVTPDVHCTGALALYGSITRNVLIQLEELQKKVCVHFTYVNTNLTTIEGMYQWTAQPNPFVHIADCAALDTSPKLNDVVPVRFQALPPLEKPKNMKARPEWVAALNKVHSWGFDLYPQILILDADSILLTDLHKIFLEASTESTIAGAADQFQDCHDRSRLNGGMILLRPSRYFHIISAELLQDPGASCLSADHDWGQSEQELLNCICGYTYHDFHPFRPEFGCNIMPVYNSVWPKNYRCSDANILPMRSIHFADATKPWDISEDKLDLRVDTAFWKCVRDGARNGSVDALKACKALELGETRVLPNLR